MCPNQCKGLFDTWGEKFEKLYVQYEKEGRGVSTIKARDLWFEIIQSQIETGVPYIVYKDACNRKSNQQNLGTVSYTHLTLPTTPYV